MERLRQGRWVLALAGSLVAMGCGGETSGPDDEVVVDSTTEATGMQTPDDDADDPRPAPASESGDAPEDGSTDDAAEPDPPDPDPPDPSDLPDPDAEVVEFHIPLGTGFGGSFNTEDQLITVYVGQTFRIINDDTTVHGLHAEGTPFRHSEFLEQGQSDDLLVEAPYDPYVVDPPEVWNHDGGYDAKFWIRAIDR